MRVGALLGITVGLAACAESPAAPLRVIDQPPSLSTEVSSDAVVFAVNRRVWVACANDGLGENVALTGDMVVHSKEQVFEDGSTRLVTQVRPSGMTGVGAVSGMKYRGVGGGMEAELFAANGDQREYLLINNFLVIGQGPGNDILVHFTMRQKYDENGALIVDVDLNNSECK